MNHVVGGNGANMDPALVGSSLKCSVCGHEAGQHFMISGYCAHVTKVYDTYRDEDGIFRQRELANPCDCDGFQEAERLQKRLV